MQRFLLAIIEFWIDTFDRQAVRDILLEFLSVIGFFILLGIIIIAMSTSPILNKHGSIEMLIFVIFGFVYSGMNLLDEFAWFTSEAYDIWKLSKDLILLVGAVFLVIGFFRFFAFSSRLFGTKEPENENLPLEEKLKDQM